MVSTAMLLQITQELTENNYLAIVRKTDPYRFHHHDPSPSRYCISYPLLFPGRHLDQFEIPRSLYAKSPLTLWENQTLCEKGIKAWSSHRDLSEYNIKPVYYVVMMLTLGQVWNIF